MVNSPTEKKALLIADADKIQGFLFEAVNLKEIMGASLLISEFNRQIKAELSSEATVIYSAGGTVKVLVDLDKVEQVENQIKTTYHQLTCSGTITLSKAIPTDTPDFLEVAEKSLRVNKSRGKQTPSLGVASPFMAHCTGCGLRPAASASVRVETYKSSNERVKEAFCETCQAKRKFSLENKALFYPTLNEHITQALAKQGISGSVSLNNPQDMGAIGIKSSPAGYVGYIVADGNRMGQKLRESLYKKKSLSLNEQIAEYQRLSTLIENTTRQALLEAVTTVFQLDDPTNLKKYQGANKDENYLPFLTLVLGGDDLVVVTTADAALPLAALLCRKYSEISEAKGDRLSISAGVTLAKENLPFLISYDLAHGLLKSAKRLSRKLTEGNGTGKGKEVGAVDFQVVTASNSLEVEAIRREMIYFDPAEETEQKAQRLVFTARPYAATDELTLQEFIIKVATLKAKDMPRSQLANLYELLNPARFNQQAQPFEQACTRLNNEYGYFVKRLTERNNLRTEWKNFQTLTKNRSGTSTQQVYFNVPGSTPPEYQVMAPDVVEIFEFISAEWSDPGRWD